METILEAINIFLYVYGVFFAMIALLGFGMQRNKERGYNTGTKISLEEVTVLIPFRNEEENLPKLLESIQSLKQLPKRFVFIDDHSEDDSASLVNAVSDKLPITLIDLDGNSQGKKFALSEGAKQVATEFTLTWDADVVVAPNYFEGIASLSEADMYVLPALFSSKSFLQSLFTFDVVVANSVNAGLAGWRRPIFASGANLLYRTSSYQQFDSLKDHGHISSGDDTFLLRDFLRNKADIRVLTNPNVAIETNAPATFREYISQRLRWVSKTNALGDYLNTFIALKQLLLMLAFIGLIVWTVANSFWFGLGYLLLCKLITDFLVFSAYFKQVKQAKLLLMLPIAELWFPIYSIFLALLIPFYKPKWKGRTVVSK
ncbi:MAG: glycosyltransferase [Crocinitomicaceae bacterium]